MGVSQDQLVSNSYGSNNPDLPVRATLTVFEKLIQHIRICFGTGSAEDVVTATNGLPVNVVAGNVSASFAPVKPEAVTTEEVVAVASTSTPILAANPNRTVGWLKNISAETIYVSLSGEATTSKPTTLRAGESLAIGNGTWCYPGEVHAIHADSGNTHNLEVVEL